MEENEQTTQPKMPMAYIIVALIFLALGLISMLWAYIPGANIIGSIIASSSASSSASSMSSSASDIGAIPVAFGLAIVAGMMVAVFVFIPSWLCIIASTIFGILSFVKYSKSSMPKERTFLLVLGIGHSVILVAAILRLILFYTISF